MQHSEKPLSATAPRGTSALPLIVSPVIWGVRDPFRGVVRVDESELYTMEQVARILHVRESRVRELARREVDPMPFVVVDGCGVPLILRRRLIEWVEAHSSPLGARPKR